MGEENTSVGAAPPAPVDAAPVVAAPAIEAAPIAAVEAPLVPESSPEAPAAAPEGEAAAAPAPVEGEAPAEKPADGAEPAAEAGVEAEKPTVEAPTYTEFKLPEGLSASPEQLEGFTGFLAEHKLTQEAGQALMDLHATALQKAVTDIQQRQVDAFDETRRNWREDFFKTAGNRADTMANDAKWAIQDLCRTKEEREEVQQMLAFTGTGDNKLMIGLLARAAKRLREPGKAPTPLPNNGARGGTRADQRYGRTQR